MTNNNNTDQVVNQNSFFVKNLNSKMNELYVFSLNESDVEGITDKDYLEGCLRDMKHYVNTLNSNLDVIENRILELDPNETKSIW